MSFVPHFKLVSSFDLPCHSCSLPNCFHTGHQCECDARQTMSHIVDACRVPSQKRDGRVLTFHGVKEDAVNWLKTATKAVAKWTEASRLELVVLHRIRSRANGQWTCGAAGSHTTVWVCRTRPPYRSHTFSVPPRVGGWVGLVHSRRTVSNLWLLVRQCFCAWLLPRCACLRVCVCRSQLVDSQALKISSVQSSDEGVYVCHAENTAGSSETHAKLTVLSMTSTLVIVL